MFDTSLLHEAANEAESVRYILMLRVWYVCVCVCVCVFVCVCVCVWVWVFVCVCVCV
jgi:hypothetical protein